MAASLEIKEFRSKSISPITLFSRFTHVVSVTFARDHLNSFNIDGIKSDLYAGGVSSNRPAAIKKASIQSYIDEQKKRKYGLVELTFDFSIRHMHL